MIELALGLVPTMPLFFPTGEVNLPWLEKENVCKWLDVGNSGMLMPGCSNVHIIEEYSIFSVTFNAAIWGSLEA